MAATLRGNADQSIVSPGRVETLRAVAALAPATCGRFREPIAFQQLSSQQYFVFDRRGHRVYSIDPDRQTTRTLVEIGGEEGRIISASAFALAPDGTFAVADSPGGRARVQIFGAGGFLRNGFFLPGRVTPRVVFGGATLSGIGSLAFTGSAIYLSQPETGALLTEYGLNGQATRSFGELRRTGFESDRELHLAMNTAIPLVRRDGGLDAVFLAGTPALRRYAENGALRYERHLQGREIDALLAALPTTWPRREIDVTELPVVVPHVRAAAVDRDDRLWIVLSTGAAYVYDAEGEKVRTVEFRGAGPVAPASVFFSPTGRLLATPGCYEFAP